MQLAPDCRETLEEDAVQVTHRFCHFSLSMCHMGPFSRDLCRGKHHLFAAAHPWSKVWQAAMLLFACRVIFQSENLPTYLAFYPSWFALLNVWVLWNGKTKWAPHWVAFARWSLFQCRYCVRRHTWLTSVSFQSAYSVICGVTETQPCRQFSQTS